MDRKAFETKRRFDRMRSAAALLLSSAALLACSARGESSGELKHSIAGGDADLSHHNVFLLVARHENSGGLCTATLIAPNLLLTARHCVSPGVGDDHVLCGESVLGEPYPASAFYATNAPKPREDSLFFRAVDVRVPVQGEDTCGFDVALVILDENVPSSLSQPAVPRIDREVVPGEPYTAVGYGVNEDGNSTGSRMQRDGLSIDCQPGSCGSGVESTEFRGETGICSGDSGGPALDADGKVVGVVSRGGPDCSTPVYGTVTAWRDFLTKTADEAAKLGGYQAPFWVTTGFSDPPELPNDGAGGEAGAAGAPGRPAAGAGDSCSSDVTCGSGLLCYADSGDASQALCVAECETSAECSAGQECQAVGSASICTTPHGKGADDSGCSIAAAGKSSPFGLGLLALLGLAGLFRRRARSA
jgi:MYXO-CTERM domain-containing protein